MEQRRLRLGDILDDYCPRERRVTNHAVVAMIEEDVKQTRCTTCEAEHAYKGGHAPRRRKKETTAALYKEVLAGMPETEATPALVVDAPLDVVDAASPDPDLDEPVVEDVQPVMAADAGRAGDEGDETYEDGPPAVEEGPVHRPLIRATLPRPEGMKTERPLPEFTIRQNGGRGNGHFRGDRSKGRGGFGAQGAGNRPQGGGRFGGGRPGGAQRGNAGGGFRGGQARPGQGQGHGRKRGRGGSRG